MYMYMYIHMIVIESQVFTCFVYESSTYIKYSIINKY